MLMFRFPFVIATTQAAIAVALLLWASLARFGTPQSAPIIAVGRQGLLKMWQSSSNSPVISSVMVRRYVQETIRDVARQLHAPSALAGEQLVAWLQRVGAARSACGLRVIVQRVSESAEARRGDLTQLVRMRAIYTMEAGDRRWNFRNSRTH